MQCPLNMVLSRSMPQIKLCTHWLIKMWLYLTSPNSIPPQISHPYQFQGILWRHRIKPLPQKMRIAFVRVWVVLERALSPHSKASAQRKCGFTFPAPYGPTTHMAKLRRFFLIPFLPFLTQVFMYLDWPWTCSIAEMTLNFWISAFCWDYRCHHTLFMLLEVNPSASCIAY